MSWGAARDPKDVNAIKKPIASAYSFSNVLQYQPLVDQVISKFMNRLHEEFICRKDRVCDMALWLRLCKSMNMSNDLKHTEVYSRHSHERRDHAVDFQ